MGREFQSLGATAENARSPYMYVFRRVLGTRRLSPDVRKPGRSLCIIIYLGDWSCKALKVRPKATGANSPMHPLLEINIHFPVFLRLLLFDPPPPQPCQKALHGHVILIFATWKGNTEIFVILCNFFVLLFSEHTQTTQVKNTKSSPTYYTSIQHDFVTI